MHEYFGDRAYQLFSLLYTDHAIRADDPDEGVCKNRLESILLNFRHIYTEEFCDSPIENILFSALLFESNGYHPFDICTLDILEGTNGVKSYLDIKPRKDMETIVVPQVKIGDYVADFLFTCSFRGSVSRFIVECDGHDFHEKTKEQAKRDKRRDRWLLSKGISSLRFTGSEIYQDPIRCAEEISLYATLKIDELLEGAGIITGNKAATR